MLKCPGDDTNKHERNVPRASDMCTISTEKNPFTEVTSTRKAKQSDISEVQMSLITAACIF